MLGEAVIAPVGETRKQSEAKVKAMTGAKKIQEILDEYGLKMTIMITPKDEKRT